MNQDLQSTPPLIPEVRPPHRRRLKISGLLFLGLLLAGSGVAYWFYSVLHRPHHHQQINQTITIAPGTTASEIIEQLTAAHILPDSLPVHWWLRLASSKQNLKAGDYRFPSPITPLAVVQTLVEGRVFTQRVTFPEGLTRVEVAQIIDGLGMPGTNDALSLTENPDLIKDLDPEATTLEGYLFPDTYQYTSTTTTEQLVRRMVARFRQVFNQDLQRRAQEIGFTVREAVTLASMVEREAKVPEERPPISSVFHNRLRLGMKLDCDPTVIYASMLANKWTGTIRQSDLKRTSPYNTYLYAGLPPGPIASPGQAAMIAALNPAQTDYLYFVVDGTRDDGSHRFSTSPREHQANVVLYRQREQITHRNKD